MALAAVLLAASARADVLRVPQDFPGVQDAVDAAVAGDEIVIAAGTYEGLVTIDGKTDLRLRGKGQVLLTGSVPGEANVAVIGSSDIVLERLRITGSEGDGLVVVKCTGVTIRHCRIEQSADRGLVIATGTQHLVQHLVVTGTGGAGIEALEADFVTLSRCSVSDAGQHGILISSGNGHLVEHVSVEDVEVVGILLDSAAFTTQTGTILRKCVVRDTGSQGIVLDGRALLVERNRVLDAGGSGLAVSGALDSLVRDNRIVDAVHHGITVGTSCEIRDNRVIRCELLGLVVDSGSPVLTGNRVIEPGLDGLSIATPSVGSTLLDNTVTAPGQNGIVVSGDATQLVGNRVTNAVLDGFSVDGSGCLFLDNTAKGSAGFDLVDSLGNGNIYVDNHFGTTQFE